ncbi:MAG: O-antigen ligase family protein [Candidatus Doudnabacteria bacterium]|jgi:O-antigen ligase
MVELIKKIRLPFREDNIFSLLFLLVLSVPLAFTIYTRENFETIKYALWLILFGVTVIALGFKKPHLQGESPQSKLPRTVGVLLGLFIFFILVSSIFSPDWINSVFGFYYRFANSLLFYGLWAGTILVLLIKGNRERLLVLIKVLIFDALIISVVGILQTQGIGYYEGLDMAVFARSPSLLGNPIFSSMFVAGLMPFVVYFWHQAEKFSAKLYYALAGFFMVVCVIVLTSRGAWLGAGVGFLIMLVISALYSKNKKIISSGIIGIILVSVLAVGFFKVYPAQNGRLTLSLSEENATTRLYAWGMAREAIIVHPLVGVGMGNFQQFFEQNREKYLSNSVQNFDDAHNLFLQLAATAGLPAVSAFVGLLAAAIFFAIGNFKKHRDYLAVAVIGSVVIFSISASFTPVAIPCFLSLGVVLALAFSLEDRGELSAASLKKPTKLAYFIIGACLVIMGLGLITAEHIFYRAYWAYSYRDYHTAQKLSTWAIYLNPTNQLYYLYKAGSQVLGGAGPEDIAKTKKSLVDLHPNAAITYAMSGTLNFLSFLKTADQQYFQAAVNSMTRSLKIDPFAANRYVRLGYFYLYHYEPDTARELTKSGLSLDKQYLPGWFQLAKIYQIQGKKPQLIYALDNALKIRPDIMELRALAKMAKESVDVKTVPVNLPPEQGQLE